MPRKAYTTLQKAEAVALAKVIGSEAAGKELGIDPRTVLKWLVQAGNAPELTVPAGTFRELMELAIARATAAVASGKLPAWEIARIGGIAARNAYREEPPAPPEEKDPAQVWLEGLEAWAAEHRPDLLELHDGSLQLAEPVLQLLIRENTDREREGLPPLELEDYQPFLENLDPAAWTAAHDAKEEAHRAHVTTLAQEARVKWAPVLDPEVEALIAEVDRLLAGEPEPIPDIPDIED